VTICTTDRVLVTGATGLVGNATAVLLRSKDYQVVTHARRAAPGIDWVADLGGRCAASQCLPDDIAAVVHCAAAIPARSQAFARDNIGATAELAAVFETTHSLKRIVHLSSVAVYKRPPSGSWIISEDAETVYADDPGADAYARSKRASELELDSLAARRPEVKLTHIRASSIYGPGMALTTLLPASVARALRNEPLCLFGPRDYVQNFIHVRDVAELVLALLCDDNSPRIVNAFSDDTYGSMALAELVRTTLNSRSQVVDATDDTGSPKPIFVNKRAKRLHSRFRSLADHLFDAA
jgi:nucleoside-diphosphate-sugar epimerase